jgi:hypothetical protein
MAGSISCWQWDSAQLHKLPGSQPIFFISIMRELNYILPKAYSVLPCCHIMGL